MAYSEFTLESVVSTFQLEKVDTAGLFSEIDPVNPSEYLTTGLAKKAPLAAAIGTEKARSEMIVADVLVDLLEHLDRRISLFSGIEFSVDPESGLTGGVRFFGKSVVEPILCGSTCHYSCRSKKYGRETWYGTVYRRDDRRPTL